ncbi:ABC transporter permease [Brevibacillus fluminis]|uniref:ABC transporter permease n=1 Tax=Brevibacillus fluminis TaxID=511487 RepID=A0A3M8DWN1_9BACL|nr:ABC transporter permease subunit [Brevibacillus fluminis]RNB91701.1 ABC transporter permease [Brevibacillus fluminis]
MKGFFSNPLIVKEMRERFRSKKSFWILGIYLFVMGAILLGFMYVEQLDKSLVPGENREWFILIAGLQYGMICFIAPALSAGTISGERERQTLHVLLTTQLSPLSIIWSKLVTSLAFISVLVLSSLPLYSFVFLYGGMSPQQLATLVLFFGVNILFFGSLGLFCSTCIKRTGVSTITSYGIAFFFVVGTGLLLLFIGNLLREIMPSQYPFEEVWQLPVLKVLAMLNPVVVMGELFGETIGPMTDFPMPPWAAFSIVYVALSIGLILVSGYLLRPNRKQRWGWKKA